MALGRLRGLGARSRVGRYTQRLHLRTAALDGAVQGVFLLNEYVAKKTLDASDPLLTALVIAPTASFLFSAWWAGHLAGREKRSTFLVFGLLGRLSLAAVALTGGAAGFVGVIAAGTFFGGAAIPAQNALYQRNYAPSERGRVIGLAIAISSVTTIACSLLAGRLYDAHPELWRPVYAAAGIVGFFSFFLLARLRFRARPGEARERPLFRRGLGAELRRSLRRPFAGALTILRGDAGFRRYEAAFMSYGMAWMMMQPVIPVHLVERLHVAYSQASQARGLIYFGVLALCSPLFGRLLDRVGPLRLSRGAFLTLALFPLLLAAADRIGLVYLAFLVYGAGMAAVNLGWTMGPIHFAGSRDSAGHMGAHVALVGVRSFLGGPLGITIYRLTGSPLATFAAASALFLLGSLIMSSGADPRRHAGAQGRG